MILQRLAEHYDRIAATGEGELAPPGYSVQKVSFCIVLESDGRLNSFQDLRRPEGKRLRPRMLLVPGQGKPSGSGLNPRLLCDNSSYLLGWNADLQKMQRAQREFGALRKLHLKLEASVNHPAFTAVCNFLRTWEPELARSYASELTDRATNFGIFQIAGDRYVHDLVDRCLVTDQPTFEATKVPSTVRGTCLITGKEAEIARLHEPAIKGVKDANPMGAKLVSFDKDAFTSYGKDQSRNAPVSIEAAFKYTNALNHLLSRSDRRTGLGDATVVFWADSANPVDEATLDVFAALIGGAVTAADVPDAAAAEDQNALDEASTLLDQLKNGTARTGLKPEEKRTRFFILGLSPNVSRLSVRLWVETDALEMRLRLAAHVQDLALSGGRDDRPLSLWRIVAATGRAERDKKAGRSKFSTEAVSPQLAGDLTRSVLLGASYPQSLLATMIRRIRSDGEIAFARVSAIKAVLVRNSRLRGAPMEVPVELNTELPDVAYRCGRIFALLEQAQSDTLGGDLNSTVKDRYFSSVSATPALVFPRLFRLNTHHLAKLDNIAKPGHRNKSYFERRFRAAMAEPFHFPRQLSLEEQGRFIVGYFQQHQDFYIKHDKTQQEENTTA